MMRRFGILVIALIAQVSLVRADDARREAEAKKLYEGVETLIRSADAVQIKGERVLNSMGSGQYSILLTKKNQAKIYASDFVLNRVTWEMISDGESLLQGYTDSHDPARAVPLTKFKVMKTPPDLYERFISLLSRPGVGLQNLNDPRYTMLNLNFREDGPTWKQDQFRVLPLGKLGDRPAKVIEFFQTSDRGVGYPIVLFIDAKSGLPLRTLLASAPDDPKARYEAYTEIILNPKIDPAVFKLPK